MANVRLKRGDQFLLQVSHYFGEEVICRGLAASLLETSPCGGKAYIDKYISTGAHMNWQVMAHNVLEEWCTTVPVSATSVSLHQTCVQLKAHEAARFVAEHFHQASTEEEVKCCTCHT